MKILDLFCGAGGAAMGLHWYFPNAEITGVDLALQKHYLFKARAEMECEWMTADEMSQAVPPCYSQYLAQFIPT